MQSPSFPAFSRELAEHPEPGYHSAYGLIDRATCNRWFSERSIRCPKSYLTFLNEIGPGRFFAGGLEFYSLDPLGTMRPNGLATVTDELPNLEKARFLAIAYDGSTEGCYCLNRLGDDETVYWHSWDAGETARYHPDFSRWIESLPKQLFSPNGYAGYKKIRDIDGVRKIIAERASFDIRLLLYDKQLVRPPGKEKDFLPRFHRIFFGVRKLQDSSLRKLTIKVLRTGSSVGAANSAYVTIELPDFPVAEEIRIEGLVFDPFNRPFEEIVVQYSPEVDINSASRAHFAELTEYL